jgi:pSer/pThr/pTyr-binding forkhead associated (FHA) protein
MSDSAAGEGRRSLVVVAGQQSGQRLQVHSGEWTVGRDPACDFVLSDDGVSRRHARLINDTGGLSIEDAGSTNGTWVDDERVTGRRAVVGGEHLRLGGAVLRVEPSASDPAPSQQTAPRPKVSLVRVALVGGLANLVLLAAGVLIQLATDWTGIGPWLAAPLVGMVASLVQVGKESLTRPPAPSRPPRPEPTPSAGGSRRESSETTAPHSPARRARAPIGAGIAVAVLIIGGGGLALAYGVGMVSSYVTGNQSGTERLTATVALEASGVTTAVSSVEQTRDFTRVTVSVRNGLSNTITLPVFRNATLSAADGRTLQADSFRSSWSETIGPGQLVSGVVVFPGRLADVETTATFSFATVFEQGFDGPRSIAVEGLVLRAIE